jgi:aminomuconate-semialdehyde/2-hydroxymuconate-6-semialdehyde dehydrogenase
MQILFSVVLLTNKDANLDEAIRVSLRSSFLNQGEICLCGSRIFVHESIYDTFLTRFTAEAEKMVLGDPLDANTQVGALVSKQHIDKVDSYIQIAKSEGGNIVTGGKIDGMGGYFMRPTIITGLHATESRVQKEEIFGPVYTFN